ncbi:MAG TPA: type IV pilus twitching motility protein PilT [Candidatus Sulfotelmatobacter sp.]|nr:type IV pilus twitching motility protein PilT [Candidatus Sulfotelmatobacter sp.]
MAIDLTAILAFAKDQGASDVHIVPGMAPVLRLRGETRPLEMAPLSPDATRAAIYDLMNDEQKKVFEERHDLDFAFEIPGLSRFRANVLVQRQGVGAVFRLVPSQVKSLEELAMPPVLQQLSQLERGLVVVTGPTGSGKSTTLAAMVDWINSNERLHILTIEDPIEFVHQPKKSVVTQREVGPHTQSFSNALKAALREDPDVILVGELRDLETTQLAITAAETGHLVFGTLHTNSASKTIDRIIDIFPSGQQAQVRTMLSESIEGVVAQTLLPAKDAKGRVAALEVLVGVPALRNLIREDKTAQILSVIQTGAQHGMISLDQHLRELVMQGRLAREVAMKRSSNPKLFEQPAPTSTVSAGVGSGFEPATPAAGVAARPPAAPAAGAPRPAAPSAAGAARPVAPPAARPPATGGMGPPTPPKKPGFFGR